MTKLQQNVQKSNKSLFISQLFSMSSIKVQQINKIDVKPVIAKGGEPSAELIKGYDYIPLLYANIFLCAKKKSGKTNAIYHLVENLATTKTKVYIFCSTVHKDTTYKAIMKMLKKKNISFEANTSFFDKDGKKNLLKEILTDEQDLEKSSVVFEKLPTKKPLRKGHDNLIGDVPSWYHANSPYGQAMRNNNLQHNPGNNTRDGDYGTRHYDRRVDRTQREYTPVFGPPETLAMRKGVKIPVPAEGADFDDEVSYQAPKKAGKDVQAPDDIFVFDDLGADLRHPSITQLLKTNRHERCKVILSSQYLTDLQPAAIKQIDFCLLFKSFGKDKLEKMYEHLDLSINMNQFQQLYDYATSAPFSFLYIDVRAEQFRKNFNTKLSITGMKEDKPKKDDTPSNKKQKTKQNSDDDNDNDENSE
jgi:hypothetical protein